MSASRRNPRPGNRVRVTYEGYWIEGSRIPGDSEIAGRIVRDEESFVHFALPAWADVEVLTKREQPISDAESEAT